MWPWSTVWISTQGSFTIRDECTCGPQWTTQQFYCDWQCLHDYDCLEPCCNSQKPGKSPVLSLTEIQPAAWKTDTNNNAPKCFTTTSPPSVTDDLHDTHALRLIQHSSAILMLPSAIWFHPTEAELQELKCFCMHNVVGEVPWSTDSLLNCIIEKTK
jgi:hypothetical protein